MGRLVKEALWPYRRFVLKDPMINNCYLPETDDIEWGWDDEKRKLVKLGPRKKVDFNPDDYEDPWDREVARINSLDPEITEKRIAAIEHVTGVRL